MDYSKANNNTSDIPGRNRADVKGFEWQIDSEWIDLSSSSITPSSENNRKESKSKPSSVPKDYPSFHFTPTSRGDRFLIVDQQALRLSQKTESGFSYWVCNIPCCNAQCILDPEEKKITRYCGDHNHEAGVSRIIYKNFINALKIAVKENPHVKPKDLFEKEVERIKSEWKDSELRNVNEELSLPDFDDVQTAMNNTRNTILSSFSLRPIEESKSEGKPTSKGPSRYTRSKDVSSGGKKKPTSKSLSPSSADLEELEDVWTSQAHKDASLSDIEDWLDEDANANISPTEDANANISPTEDANANISPTEDANANISPTVKHNTSSDGVLDSTQPKSEMEFSHESEGDLWNATIPLEKIPRRKYRKRPASMSVFTCPHCPYKSNRHFNVQRHERLAHSSKKPEFSCKECGTSYSLEYRLKLHIKAVHQGEGHHCHICSRTFETMTGLKSHLVTKHKNESTKVQRELPPELTCKLCCRVFTTKAHLQKHTSTHVMVQPYRCYSCNQPFLDECTWLTHQNNCNEAFTIQCCLCSRVIPSAQELLTHMDDVHGRAEYSCNCGKSFPWKKSLLTHQQKCSLYLSEKTPST